MKTFLTLLIASFSLVSFGQENATPTIVIAWEQLSAPLLIHPKKESVEKYELLKVDLSVDLRKQYLKENSLPIMYLPENQYVEQEYTIAFPQSNTNTPNFTISGNGYNSNSNNGGIKNTAYKDASLYSGAFCPITGLAY